MTNEKTSPSIRTVHPEFAVHILNDDGIRKATEIADVFNQTLYALSDVCPQKTREFSLVKTKLEEACFFAKKAMAGDPANQRDNPATTEKAA